MTINELKMYKLAIDIIETCGNIEHLNKRLETKIKIYNKIRKEIHEKSLNIINSQNNLQIDLAKISTDITNERNTNKKSKTKKSTSSNGS